LFVRIGSVSGVCSALSYARKTYVPPKPANDNRPRQAYNAMLEIRNSLYRRMVEYVLTNHGQMLSEVNGEDSYNFTLQQMDEQFLNKMNVIERALCELARCEQREGQMMTTFETVEVVAKREELPQKVADALAEHGESDLLDLCVLRADEKQAEVLLVLAREDNAACAPAPRVEKGGRGEQGEKGEDHGKDEGGHMR
jgi:hypothetical protein